MNIRTITQNLELTDAITEYVNKKLISIERLLKNMPPETMIEVDLGKDAKHRKGQGFRAEMSIKLPSKRLYAAAKDSDLYAAIDKVKDEIISELKKDSSKKRDNERRSGSKQKREAQKLG
jgi:ribosomal subunit interface protein